MRQFISRNAPLIVTITVLIIGLAVAWGVIQTDVGYNATAISENRADIRETQAEIVDGRITRQEILTKLSYIEALLLELRDK